MKKLFHTHISTAGGLALVAVVSFIMGGLFLKEARSFMEPGAGPGGPGSLAPDGGLIGDPTQGITGADTLFKGQKAIKDAIGGGGGGGLHTKRVFVTSTIYNGNLGGLAGADAKCQARADVASLGGTWKAILSDQTVDAIDRIGYQWDKLVDTKGKGIVSNERLWKRFDFSWDGSVFGYRSLYRELDRDEFGNQLLSGPWYVWTGSYAGGQEDFPTGSSTCSSWTSTTVGSGTVGRVGQIDDSWVKAGILLCSSPTASLYCIEQ